MRILRGIDLIGSSTEEMLPDWDPAFPCITSQAELYSYPDGLVPWHWHPAAELFYMLDGELEYCLPEQTLHFPQGSGGLLLPSILHRTVWPQQGKTVQLLHLFDPGLLFGGYDTRMGQKYLLPLLSSSGTSILPLSPDVPEQARLLAALRNTFELDESAWDYELTLREALARLWADLASQPRDSVTDAKYGKATETVKQMLVFIRQNLAEPLDAETVAESAHVSLRNCYRLFRQTLHTTPNEYIQSCRIREASLLLSRAEEISITEIAMRCGFSNSSYFGRVFRKTTGMTPMDFRKWHNNTKT